MNELCVWTEYKSCVAGVRDKWLYCKQPALQQLLYDIEAGMPFLFVDQLVAQAPVAGGEGGRLRVVLGISGLWPGAK